MIGIYILYENDKIVYIGKSSRNMLHRIRTHTIDKFFTKSVMYEMNNEADMNILELYLIGKHKPIYNKHSNTTHIPTIIIDEFKILKNPVDITEDAMKWKVKNMSKVKDYILAKRIIEELLEEGYTGREISCMIE